MRTDGIQAKLTVGIADFVREADECGSDMLSKAEQHFYKMLRRTLIRLLVKRVGRVLVGR